MLGKQSSAVVTATFAFTILVGSVLVAQTGTAPRPAAPRAAPRAAPATPQPRRTADIVRETRPAIAVVTGRTTAGEESVGTAFVVDRSGIMVTNLHVIQGMASLRVQFPNGDAYDRVTVRAFDEQKDLAIIHVPGFALPVVRLGNSDTVQQGDDVLLIGNPRGLEGTVSSGLVSAIRPLNAMRVFQTDAAANPGNSGGPMLNDRGEVVGVLSFGFVEDQNLNFVVPINYARGLLQVNENLSLAQVNARLAPRTAVVAPVASPTPSPTPSPSPIPVVVAAAATPASTATLAPVIPAGATRMRAGYARIVVFRPQNTFGMGVDPSVRLNGVELVKMDNGRYFWIDVMPGPQSIQASCRNSAVTTDIKAGETRFVYVYPDEPCTGRLRFAVQFSVSLTADSSFIQSMRPLDQEQVRHPAVLVR